MRWVELGRLGAPYGIRGWIHVESHTDPPQGLLEYRPWILRLANGERLTRQVKEARAHASGLVAHLEGVADRDQAAALTGAVVEIERSVLPPAGDREYYRTDLLGFVVTNLEGAALGTVSHFVDMPTGPVMVTQAADGRQHWVLAVPKHLRKVDLAAHLIVVDWPAELD